MSSPSLASLIRSALPHPASLYSSSPSNYPRITCCGSASKFYCPQCCSPLAAPAAPAPPAPVLPFDIVVLLDDSRSVATGLHLKALCPSQVTVVCPPLPPLAASPASPATYVLFPCAASVPLSSLPPPSRLLLLDCRWTRTTPLLSSLPPALTRVHLSEPPGESVHWRWHDEGEGMLCTLEAAFVAVVETLRREPGGAPNRVEEMKGLFHLFGLQRAAIEESKKTRPNGGRYKRTVDPGLPWEKGAKEFMVGERAQKGTERWKGQKEESKKKTKS
ncbi:hypothetical protein TeGR_g11245 [Tetraparma gracilis]|uniref:tRNA-uridine aminocarboxypropyltransferase 1 n=1 Tax=Tetraparma gracilis TaxID=2962635 RepID=A0ABQ6MF03_9STRA|nr:hypothetical protein TeGR_g11245 [Tetraparma gracilis]